MRKHLLLLLCLLVFNNLYAQDEELQTGNAKGKIAGKITEHGGDPALGAQLFVYTTDNSAIVGAANTGDDNTNSGKFTTNAIDTGIYNVHIKYTSYRTTIITDVPVKLNKTTVLNIKLSPQMPDVPDEDTITYAMIAPKPKVKPAPPKPDANKQPEKKK